MWCPECKRTKNINFVMKQKPNGNYFCPNCKHIKLASLNINPNPSITCGRCGVSMNSSLPFCMACITKLTGLLNGTAGANPAFQTYGGQSRSKSSNTSRILSHCKDCNCEIWAFKAMMYCTSCQKQRMKASYPYIPSSYGQSIPKSSKPPNTSMNNIRSEYICPSCGSHLTQLWSNKNQRLEDAFSCHNQICEEFTTHFAVIDLINKVFYTKRYTISYYDYNCKIYNESIAQGSKNPPAMCPNCYMTMEQIYDLANKQWYYRCGYSIANWCSTKNYTPASLKVEAERIFLKMTKELRYTKIFNNTIIELYFITQYKRGWFAENIKPVLELMKSQIPSSMREYDPKTFKWQIDSTYWPALQQMLEALNFTCTEEFPKVGAGVDPLKNINVPKDYAENFHYAPESTDQVEDKFALETKLAEFGVSNKSEYRAACRRLHPDLGGDAMKMSELNRLWTLYQKQLEVGVIV